MAAPWEAPDGSGVDVNHPYGPGSTPSSTAALRCDLGRAINPPPTHQAANKAGKGSAASARGEQPGPGACTERRRRKRANKGERGCAPSSASCGSVRAQHLVLQGLRAKGGQGAEVLPALQRRAQFPSALQRGAVLSPALPIARCSIPSCPIARSCIPPLPYRGELKSCPVLQRGAPGLSCLGSCVALKEKSGILCHHCRPLRGLFSHISPAPHWVGITERLGLEGTAKGHKFSGTACPWCCWFPPIPSSLLSMCLSRALRRPPGTLACLPFSWDAVLLGLEGMVLEGRRWSLGGRRWSLELTTTELCTTASKQWQFGRLGRNQAEFG